MPHASPRIFAALFLVTLSTLTYELLLTRVFSVTMYYHFAFVAISVAMFGMVAGALAVYLRPHVFTPDRLGRNLTSAAVWFAVTLLASFVTHILVPFLPEATLLGLLSIVLTYVVLCVPFTFSGVVVALALTRFPRQVSALYAMDLAGAALGCALLGPLIRVTDAPTAAIVIAAIAAAAALLFAIDAGAPGVRRACGGLTVALALGAAGHAYLVREGSPLLRMIWVKGGYERPPIAERWNSFSRVRVIGDPLVPRAPSGWGMSRTLPPHLRTRELHMDIDSYAGTELTAFDGDTARLEHLKYDVTNIVHYLRPASHVLVVGTGGGRDILSALAFDQRRVTGVEINDSILYFLNERFGGFTGHLDRHPRVSFANDEARSYVARLNDRVDVIQISLIDTWAATASGAFVLTENSLYTVEAWRSFLDHLAPRGILSVSRWYFADRPGEVYRIAALASTALLERGVARPGDHYAIVRARPFDERNGPNGIGTLLVSRDPLSPEDLDTLEAVAGRMQFEVVQSPRHSADATFAALANGTRLEQAIATHPLNIAAPTDDSPFFFHMLRIGDVFDVSRWRDQGIVAFNLKAVGLLGVLLVTVLTLTALCILVPLWRTRARIDLTGAAPHLLFFAAIGFGFMLIEISQVQRLTIFLGHPAYALSVVLFSLLLSSGLGSLSTTGAADTVRAAMIRIGVAVAVLAAFGMLTPATVRAFEGASNTTRVLLSIALLLPIGFCMGMAFPLGMRVALRTSPQVAPWLWGINGAASVSASVLAVVVAIGAGISAAFWAGTLCYGAALAALALETRAVQKRVQSQIRV